MATTASRSIVVFNLNNSPMALPRPARTYRSVRAGFPNPPPLLHPTNEERGMHRVGIAFSQFRAGQNTSTQCPLDAGATDIYNVGTYASFPNKEFAWKALMFERRLEFAMEGPRFFDLVRWGMAEEVLNAYLAEEKTKKDFLANAQFTAGRDEYYPIPQREIDFTGGLYIQNPGY